MLILISFKPNLGLTFQVNFDKCQPDLDLIFQFNFLISFTVNKVYYFDSIFRTRQPIPLCSVCGIVEYFRWRQYAAPSAICLCFWICIRTPLWALDSMSDRQEQDGELSTCVSVTEDGWDDRYTRMKSNMTS